MRAKRQRKPWLVGITCIDPFHGGGEAQPHLVNVMEWRDGRIVPAGNRNVRTLSYETGNDTYDFRCACGRNARLSAYQLLWKAAPLFYVNQGATRVDVDIATL